MVKNTKMIVILLVILISLCNGNNNNMNVINTKIQSKKTNKNIILNKNPIITAKATTNANTISNNNNNNNNKSNKFIKFIVDNWFILSEIAVVIFSKYKPSFFASGGKLKPGFLQFSHSLSNYKKLLSSSSLLLLLLLLLEFFVSKVGIFFIFLLNGMSISMDQLKNASSNFLLNFLTQIYSMGFIPLVTYYLTKYFVHNQSIRDGIVALSVLPCTINMCVTLTQSANGSAAAAIFNAVFGNFLGIIVSPLLILLILGTKTDFDFVPTVKKLAQLVLLPVFTGQLLRLTPVKKFMDKNKTVTKTFGELILIAIVFNTFSDSFSKGIGTEMTMELKSLFVLLPSIYLIFNAVFWTVARTFFPSVDVRNLAASMICSSQKTLAFGLPFIKTAFSTRKDLSTILTPLLIFSPTQLFCATTILVPFLKKQIATADEDPIKYYPLVKPKSHRRVDLGIRHKLKTILTTVCLLSVFFELCDEMMRDIPLFSKMRLPSLKHGVLLLSASHFIHAAEEVYNHYKNQHTTRKEADRYNKIRQLASNRYGSESDAAKAYDQAAWLRYGDAAHLNFKESLKISKQSRTSRYRGVEWDDDYQSWKLSSSIIDH